MTCVQMGGPATCTATISGATPDEMVQNGTKHLQEAHPEMAESMKTMTKEVRDKWFAEFMEKWKNTADM